MNIEYKSNNNIVYNCKYHVVWCPKYRRKVLVGNIETRLKELLKQYCNEMNIELVELEVMSEHIRLLINVDPQFGVHKAIKNLKGKTSRVLRSEFPELTTKLPTLWTNSYFVASVGRVSLEVVKQYIENQKTSQRQ